jgi:hypothetical protein
VHHHRVTVSSAVVTHVQKAHPGLLDEGSSVGHVCSNKAIRGRLNDPKTVKSLLLNADLQASPKEDEDCQDLIRGVCRIAQAARNHDRQQEDTALHIRVLESGVWSLFQHQAHRTLSIFIYGASQAFAIVRRLVLHSSESRRLQNRMNKPWPSMMRLEMNLTETRPVRKRKVPDYLLASF